MNIDHAQGKSTNYWCRNKPSKRNYHANIEISQSLEQQNDKKEGRKKGRKERRRKEKTIKMCLVEGKV